MLSREYELGQVAYETDDAIMAINPTNNFSSLNLPSFKYVGIKNDFMMLVFK